jgi:UDP-N-acetylglucosamine 2-epimerase (non-hydrolysing)
MKHITIVAGARPNFMKIAPIIHAIQKHKVEGGELEYALVHTGQHYDEKMSKTFFNQLDIPAPHANLECGGGTQAEQTGAIMVKFEQYLQKNSTDLVVVVGDVTSTMACAIVAQKLGIKVAHVEGGLRSNDWGMPEEINRLVTDSISNYFFTTTEHASNILIGEGVSPEKIFFVGNTMIDTLIQQLPNLKEPPNWAEVGLKEQGYIVLTLHRPSNVDEVASLEALLYEICTNTEDIKIIFPAHPRTQKTLSQVNTQYRNLYVVDPLSYLEFNFLVKNSLGVITDSGGITEETTVLKVPCMTLRNTTERPETVEIGTNELLGTDPKNIRPALIRLLSNQWKKGSIPELWDGKAAERIVAKILEL